MFQFSGFAHYCGYSSNNQVSPFGNPRINSYLLIPAAYRSLSRPSSPLRAKASPVYPFLLSSTIPPFARYVCFFSLVASSQYHVSSIFVLRLDTCYLIPNTPVLSLLLSSLSIYFFQ